MARFKKKFGEAGKNRREVGEVEKKPGKDGEAMKRFLLFVFVADGQKGGWDDFVDSYETKEQAGEATYPMARDSVDKFYQVIDSREGTMVERGRVAPSPEEIAEALGMVRR